MGISRVTKLCTVWLPRSSCTLKPRRLIIFWESFQSTFSWTSLHHNLLNLYCHIICTSFMAVKYLNLLVWLTIVQAPAFNDLVSQSILTQEVHILCHLISQNITFNILCGLFSPNCGALYSDGLYWPIKFINYDADMVFFCATF